MKPSHWLLPLLACLAFTGGAACALDQDGDKINFRWEILKIEGELFRFDRKTGELERIEVGKELKKVEPRTAPASEPERPRERPRPSNNAPIIDELDGVKLAPENEYLVPREIGDAHRRACQRVLAEYAGNLGLISTTCIKGDRIQGLISVRNNGDRKLEALELTLEVPTPNPNTKDGVETFRFVLGYQPENPAKPPQPAKKPDEKPTSVYLKVDVQAPPGSVGKPDLKPTYLKFSNP